jgi:hypothetical protein
MKVSGYNSISVSLGKRVDAVKQQRLRFYSVSSSDSSRRPILLRPNPQSLLSRYFTSLFVQGETRNGKRSTKK